MAFEGNTDRVEDRHGGIKVLGTSGHPVVWVPLTST